MDYTIFDIETDNLRDCVTTFHCFCWYRSDETSGTITNPLEVKPFVDNQNVLVGHNIKLYDNPVIKKLLGFEITKRCIDTLPVSWYLYPKMKKHGLEYWGNLLGVSKPEITNWTNLSLAQYVFRCQQDVTINRLLFQKFISHLLLIYDNQNIDGILDYLTYKMDCASEQWDNVLKIDRVHCQKYFDEITPLLAEKCRLLSEVMPPTNKYASRAIPKVMYLKLKKDQTEQTLSANGAKWMELLFDLNLPCDFTEPIKVISKVVPANPNSPVQIKNWLFSLGWQPTLYAHKKNTKGIVKAVPQLTDKDGNICLNIQVMFEQHPHLRQLESFSMLNHRHKVFRAFLECSDEQGNLRAEIAGLTNTLRFKHTKPIANLPKVSKPYGKEIRGAIIAPTENHLFCGSDMSALEDSTKQHYMYYYDPDYVNEMRVPGFDPHLDIALQGEMLTLEQIDRHKDGTEKQDKLRGDAKQVNFSAVYGVGPPKLSLTTGWTIEKSTKMLVIYWIRNRAVKQVARDITVKVIFKDKTVKNYLGKYLLDLNRADNAQFMSQVSEMWLFNPVSKLWYSLRYFKDIFSTLNQGTGVYCFDTWVSRVRSKGIKISLQYHDEVGFPLLLQDKDKTQQALLSAIEETNDILKLNVPLGISIDFGKNYAETH